MGSSKLPEEPKWVTNYNGVELSYYENLSNNTVDGEIWKDVTGYAGLYQVSSLGRVRSLPKKMGRYSQYTVPDRILKQGIERGGYLYIVLYINKKRLAQKVHRLVAQAFIPNPNSLPQVNHKDGVKTNNLPSNLEWVTASDNQKHAYRTGLKIPLRAINNIKSKPIIQKDLNGNFIRQYDGMRDMEHKTGFSRSAVKKHCDGNVNYSHAYGYLWELKSV